jgi:hypothetical protein
LIIEVFENTTQENSDALKASLLEAGKSKDENFEDRDCNYFD